MNPSLPLLAALLLAPLAALYAAEPPRKILFRLKNGELRHYDYGIDPMPELLSHSYFLPTNYVFSRDQGLTCETQIWQDVSLLKKGLFHPPIRVDAEIEVTLDGQPFGKLPVTRQSRQGISYVHFQSTSSTRDSGLLIESVRAEITHP